MPMSASTTARGVVRGPALVAHVDVDAGAVAVEDVASPTPICARRGDADVLAARQHASPMPMSTSSGGRRAAVGVAQVDDHPAHASS